MIGKNLARAFYSILWFGISLALLAGCAATDTSYAGADVVDNLSGAVEEGFARAYAPVEFEFPKDHGAHPEYQTEWWYFTGTLQNERMDRYGYQFTVFRNALTPEAADRTSDLATNQIYLAHFALTDVKAQGHVNFERYSRGAADLAGARGEPSFQVWLEDWSVVEAEPGVLQMTVSAPSETGEVFALDLSLHMTRAPVLHGESGLSQKGPEPGNASYYYSMVGLDTSGTITWAGRQESVEGLSWMDHEYGSSALAENAVGWDWFSAQLDNGDVLMLAHIRTRDGGLIDEMQGTYAKLNGETLPLFIDDYEIAVLDEWTSPTTQVTYPSGWQVTVPELAINLEFSPMAKNQEMLTSFIYWEGAVSIRGSVGGVPVAGTGYVELTGYGNDARDPRFQR